MLMSDNASRFFHRLLLLKIALVHWDSYSLGITRAFYKAEEERPRKYCKEKSYAGLSDFYLVSGSTFTEWLLSHLARHVPEQWHSSFPCTAHGDARIHKATIPIQIEETLGHGPQPAFCD